MGLLGGSCAGHPPVRPWITSVLCLKNGSNRTRWLLASLHILKANPRLVTGHLCGLVWARGQGTQKQNKTGWNFLWYLFAKLYPPPKLRVKIDAIKTATRFMPLKPCSLFGHKRILFHAVHTGSLRAWNVLIVSSDQFWFFFPLWVQSLWVHFCKWTIWLALQNEILFADAIWFWY